MNCHGIYDAADDAVDAVIIIHGHMLQPHPDLDFFDFLDFFDDFAGYCEMYLRPPLDDCREKSEIEICECVFCKPICNAELQAFRFHSLSLA